MSFNINRFKSEGLREGGARSSHFEVLLTVPTPVLTSETNIQSRARFLIKAAELPPMQIDPVEIPYFGRRIKVHGDRVYPDWTITILNDQDFALKFLFEKWSNKINTIISNRLDVDVAPLSYKTDLEIVQYKSTGVIAAQYKMVGAFPTMIDPIPVDWDATNNIEQFNVTFSYDWWEPVNSQEYSPTLPTDSNLLR